MKAILLGLVLAIGLGFGASFILAESQRSAYDAFATSSVRVGVPGENLVGPEWAIDDAGPDNAIGSRG